MHPLQAQYLEAKAIHHVEYLALPDSEDVPDEQWEAFEQAERDLREARYNLCKWGVEFAQSLPACSEKQRTILKVMWATASRSPVSLNKLADIVIRLDYTS